MERYALISDVHANITALDAVVSDIYNVGCSNILCCGDLAGYGPNPNEVIERIRELNIPSVMGNYDEAVGFLLPACGCNINSLRQKFLSDNSLKWTITNTSPENREFLRRLPEYYELSIGNEQAFLVHSSPHSMTEYIYEEDCERICEIMNDMGKNLYVYGHTHFPYIKYTDNKIIINPGSVGRPKNCDNRSSYVLLEFDESAIKCSLRSVTYDVEKVAFEIEKSGLDNYFADFIRNGGDIDDGCRSEGCIKCRHDKTW